MLREEYLSDARRFEQFVKDLLQTRGFRFFFGEPAMRDADFFATFADRRFRVEVKYYRTERAQGRLLEDAAQRLVSSGGTEETAMLVVSCVVPASVRAHLENSYGLLVVDRGDLYVWSQGDQVLLEQLSSLLEVAIDTEDPVLAPHSDFEAAVAKAPKPNKRRGSIRNRGKNLCDKLRAIPAGKDGWSRYEVVCTEILKYLFGGDLSCWVEQADTDDYLTRRDLVCRVKPTTEFWQFLTQHLDSRYVVFEFKNYTDAIKQGQILTTEKYLLSRGLRRTAFILTRVGADTNAVLMTKGAMREHGKLILVLTDEDLCKMLCMRDRGEDPSDLLFEIADQFFISLNR